MRDIEVLREPAAPTAAETRPGRGCAVLADATERRDRLVRQLEMADEFIDLLGEPARLSGSGCCMNPRFTGESVACRRLQRPTSA